MYKIKIIYTSTRADLCICVICSRKYAIDVMCMHKKLITYDLIFDSVTGFSDSSEYYSKFPINLISILFLFYAGFLMSCMELIYWYLYSMVQFKVGIDVWQHLSSSKFEKCLFNMLIFWYYKQGINDLTFVIMGHTL